MQKRTDRKTGKQISLLGFGAMRLPMVSAEDHSIDKAKAEALFDYAYEHGVNYFDTAYPYHEGKSELVVGEALKKYPRDSFFLADKMPTWLLKSLDDGKRIFAEQLQKTQTTYFDRYLCHAVGDSLDNFIERYEKTGILAYLNDLRREGTIRSLGFSFHGKPEVLAEIVKRNDWDFTQIQLNYLDWKMQNAEEQYRILERNNIQVVVMEPVRGGTLCNFCAEAVKMLKDAEPERSAASWAIRFAASLPNVSTVLSGMSSMEQVEDNVATMTDFKPITPAEQDLLKKAVEIYLGKGLIPCTGCRYCMDCPFGVDIPRTFAIYNNCAANDLLPAKTGNTDAFRKAFSAMPEKALATHCKACGRCAKLCPQHIDIPGRMKEIAAMLAD